jgi:hypothetical protein
MSPLRLSAAVPGVALATLLSLTACGGDGELEPGGGESPDAGLPTAASNPFADRVVSFQPGANAGFGQDLYPGVVLGPPRGEGSGAGSLDVLSLGRQGVIVLEFTDLAVVDGPGVDLIVFENAFTRFPETGVVAVSDDGVTWSEFPCDATNRPGGFPGCAGVKPVYSHPDNGISPTDPAVAGGDGFDLATIGVSRARFVRIRDSGANSYSGTSGGFDLDALAVVNGVSLRGTTP